MKKYPKSQNFSVLNKCSKLSYLGKILCYMSLTATKFARQMGIIVFFFNFLSVHSCVCIPHVMGIL